MSQVEFASGDMVRMIHKAKGVDSNGKLKMEVALEGHVPEIDATTDIDIKVWFLAFFYLLVECLLRHFWVGHDPGTETTNKPWYFLIFGRGFLF